VAAVAAAYGLTPKHRMSLLGSDKLDDIIPRAFGDWSSTDMNDEVAPKEEGSLASRLYGQTVGRMYSNARTREEIMLLVAWGDAQTNALQVHRPEVCYPAFGFDIVSSEAQRLPLLGTTALPLRRLTVRRAERIEQIVYWTRLGEYLPQTVQEQRVDRMRNAIAGLVPDGVLARFSRMTPSVSDPATTLLGFIPTMLAAVPATKRKALVGTELGGALSTAFRQSVAAAGRAP
jgi:EpsI family protein